MDSPLKIQTFLRGEGSMSELKKEPYNLKINTDSEGRRILFKYNQIKSDLSLEITREARGLILDRHNNWNVLSFPFRKFFNWEEDFATEIDWETAKVQNKLDGSCSTIYYYEGEWVMHTLGTVEGGGPVHTDELISLPFDGTFSDLFFHAWKKECGDEKFESLNKDYIYVFELMTPYNIVVKEHSDYKISLLAVRDRKTLNELPVEQFSSEFKTPKTYSFSDLTPEKLKKTLENFPPDEEGYVVRDDNFNRIKLKNPGYVMKHRMKNNAVNRKHGILEIVLNEEEDDFISSFPGLKNQIEGVKDDLDELIDFLEMKYQAFDGENVDPQDSQERKEFALKVQDQVLSSLQGYMFAKLTTDDSFEKILKDSNVSSVATSLNNFADR